MSGGQLASLDIYSAFQLLGSFLFLMFYSLLFLSQGPSGFHIVSFLTSATSDDTHGIRKRERLSITSENKTGAYESFCRLRNASHCTCFRLANSGEKTTLISISVSRWAKVSVIAFARFCPDCVRIVDNSIIEDILFQNVSNRGSDSFF